jgi:prepilin-type N-terminal cleavage/methylation domain-containing protein
MNKKGFTFVELLAVIVILSIITTLTVVSYRSYTKKAKEKELVAVRETIESAYNNYRTKTLYNGGDVIESISLSDLEGYIPDGFNYNKEQFTSEDLAKSSIKVVKKGSVINKYFDGGKCNFDEMIRLGICKTEIDDTKIDVNGNDITFDEKDGSVFKCITKDAGTLTNYCTDNGKNVIVIPSEDDAFCITLKLTDSKGKTKTLINDVDDTENKPYCKG